MVTEDMVTEREIWKWLEEVSDPEIPVLSIVDLGIVRAVQYMSQKSAAKITITPTYSGCPAMIVIGEEIRTTMKRHGVSELVLETVLSPAWTTDWMSENAKERLREYGVAHCPSFVFSHDRTRLTGSPSRVP